MEMQNYNNDILLKLIEKLNEGEFVRIGQFYLRKKNKRIEVTAFLDKKYKLISDIPIESLEIELEKTKNDFNKITSKSKLFSNFILEIGVDFSLNFDYGGGSISVCTEIDGIYKNILAS